MFNQQPPSQQPQQNESNRQISPQQIVQSLMRMDPQQRAQVLSKNPQLRFFLQQYEQQRKLHLQQQQQQQQQGIQQPQQQSLQKQQQLQQIQQQPQQQPQQPQHQIPNSIPKPVQSVAPVLQNQSVPTPNSILTPLEDSQRDKIPRKSLQKKTMKKKFLSNGEEYEENDGDENNGIKNGDIKKIHLKSINQWSNLFENENKKIPTTIKIYEELIKKDLDYDIESNNNKANKNSFDSKLTSKILNDLTYYQKIRDLRLKSMNLSTNANNLTSKFWGDGYSGYGNGFTNGKVELVLPKNSKNNQANTGDHYKGQDAENNQVVELIPIRLEFDFDKDGFKLNDTFLWNLNEKSIKLEAFVKELIKDYKIFNVNDNNILNKIVNSIKDQINDYHPMVDNPKIDLRFPINLDITISNNQLIDRFDWDLTNPENDPEEFSEILCSELSLPMEFQSAVSHQIREQCQIYIKSLYMIGYKFDGSPIISEDLKDFVRSGIDSNNVISPRYLLSDNTPSLQELSLENIERLTKEREREFRRKKRVATRVGRRGGFVLPDLHDMPKTYRTVIPNSSLPGSVNIGFESDEFTESPVDIEIPVKQLNNWEKYKIDLEKKKIQHEKDNLNLIRIMENDKVLCRKFIDKAYMKKIKGNLTFETDVINNKQKDTEAGNENGIENNSSSLIFRIKIK